MPEHREGLDAADLDAVFRDLVVDVGTRSRAYGAERARRDADVRRFAVAAGALVIVVVLALGLGGLVVHDSSVGVPVAGPPTSAAADPSSVPPTTGPDVPAPSLVTVERLNQASAGWVSWDATAPVAIETPGCPQRVARDAAPTSTDVEYYRSRAGGSSAIERLRFASPADANIVMQASVELLQTCPDTRTHFSDVSADLEVVGFTWGTGGRRAAVWVVNHGSRMDVFTSTGAPTVPRDTIDSMSRLLAADVQVP